MMDLKKEEHVFAGVVAALGAASVVLLWGRIGFGFFDMSFYIDIAYRLLNGQRMYTDIGGIPHGPLTYYVQAAFFAIFGVSALSCLIHAAVINALVAGLTYHYFSRHLRGYWPFFLALLSAFWFYGLIAFPWVERLSFLAVLVSFIIWDDLGANSTKVALKLFFIGLLTALPLWDKQNVALVAGLASGVLCLVFAYHRRKWTDIGFYLLGYTVIFLSLMAYFYWNGSEAAFYEYFGRSAGYDRFAQLNSLPDTLMYWPVTIFLLLSIVAAVSGFATRTFVYQWRAGLLLALVVLQILNSPLSAALEINDLPLTAFVIGWSIMLLGTRRKLFFVILAATILLYLVFGFYAASVRGVWSGVVVPTQNPMARIQNPFFKSLFIQKPQAEETDEMLKWLENNIKPNESFWVFPGMVVLYAATNHLSTAPLVTWEARNLVQKNIRHQDEARTIQWLKNEKPNFIILQKKPTHEGDKAHQPQFLLQVLPSLTQYIVENYEPIQEITAYKIYRILEPH